MLKPAECAHATFSRSTTSFVPLHKNTCVLCSTFEGTGALCLPNSEAILGKITFRLPLDQGTNREWYNSAVTIMHKRIYTHKVKVRRIICWMNDYKRVWVYWSKRNGYHQSAFCLFEGEGDKWPVSGDIPGVWYPLQCMGSRLERGIPGMGAVGFHIPMLDIRRHTTQPN